MDHQPAKRRVLGALNPNANLTPRPSPLSKTTFPSSTPTSPVKSKSPLKRSIAVAADENAKRARVEDDTTTAARSRTGTPDESSLFDDGETWVSSTTPGTSPSRTLTREQARERAEILRLRLGLASYKVRTGQTDVPLENLVRKPLPRDVAVHAEPAGEKTADDKEQVPQDQEPEPEQEEQAELPPLPEVQEDIRPVVGDEDARRRLQGEAMNGLLSLARSGSDD